MNTRPRIDFDELMRILMIVGFGALATWAMTAAVGFVSDYHIDGFAAGREMRTARFEGK
jgi:hypothetical protein